MVSFRDLVDRLNGKPQRERRVEFWGPFEGSADLDAALRAVIALPVDAELRDQELWQLWVESGYSKARAGEFARRGIAPKFVKEFVFLGYSADRILIAKHRHSGRLRTIPRVEVDRALLRSGVDIATEQGADLLPVVREIHEQHGWTWSDAGLLATRRIEASWIAEIEAACGSKLSVDLLIDIKRNRISVDALRTWWGRDLSVKQIRAFSERGLTPELWADFKTLQIPPDQVLADAETWSGESPSAWCSELGTPYAEALKWRTAHEDLRLAHAWKTAVGNYETYDVLSKSGIQLDELLQWNQHGVKGIRDLLEYHKMWVPADLQKWAEALDATHQTAARWFQSGLDVEICQSWKSHSFDVETAVSASQLGLEVQTVLEFRERDVDELVEIQRHADAWSPAELDKWLADLQCDPNSALEWYAKVNDIEIARRWVAAGMTIESLGPFIESGIDVDAYEQWVDLGQSELPQIIQFMTRAINPALLKKWQQLLGSAEDEIVNRWIDEPIDVNIAEQILQVEPDRGSAFGWATSRFTPEDAVTLVRRGIDIELAMGFESIGVNRADDVLAARAHNLSADDIGGWMYRLGCAVDEAIEWATVGASPEEAALCRSIEEYRRWREVGVAGADVLEKLKQLNFPPDVANSYREAGWDDLVAAAEWNAAGFDVTAATEWNSLALDVSEALKLQRSAVSASDAEAWSKLGASSADAVLQCMRGWSSLEDAKLWCAELQLAADQAVQWWHGFDDVKVAAGWAQIAPFDVAIAWASQHHVPDEAMAWIAAGVSSPDEARDWKESALAPSECLDWREHQVAPVDARRCIDYGLGFVAWRDLKARLPHSGVNEIIWAWSLDKLGYFSEDGVPTAAVYSGRPDDALAEIEMLVAIALHNGVTEVRIRHAGGSLDIDAAKLLKDPLFVRGAGRFALERVDELDPDLCIVGVVHDVAGDSSIIRMEQIAPRSELFEPISAQVAA